MLNTRDSGQRSAVSPDWKSEVSGQFAAAKSAVGVSIFLVTLAWAACAAPADSMAEPAVMQRLRARYNDTTSIEAFFDLTIYWKVREKEEKRSGHVIVARNDRFRVESGGNLWISDGRTCWQYAKPNKQVIIKDLLDVDLSMLPSQIFAQYLGAFRYRLLGSDADHDTLEGRPSAGGFIRRTRIVTGTKNNTLESIAVEDNSGNLSTYAIKKLRTGMPVNENLFTFEPPAGTNVFDSRN